MNGPRYILVAMRRSNQVKVAAASLLAILSARLFADSLDFSVLKRPSSKNGSNPSHWMTQNAKQFSKRPSSTPDAEPPIRTACKAVKQPNLVCVLPGQAAGVIFVGAHFDHVNKGKGVVDNWSGAALLPSLYRVLRIKPRQHTYIFIVFTGEESGELGSEAYVKKMTKQEVSLSKAMVNLDSLGLGPTKVWLSHSDRQLSELLNGLAITLKLPLGVINVKGWGVPIQSNLPTARLRVVPSIPLPRKLGPFCILRATTFKAFGSTTITILIDY